MVNAENANAVLSHIVGKSWRADRDIAKEIGLDVGIVRLNIDYIATEKPQFVQTSLRGVTIYIEIIHGMGAVVEKFLSGGGFEESERKQSVASAKEIIELKKLILDYKNSQNVYDDYPKVRSRAKAGFWLSVLAIIVAICSILVSILKGLILQWLHLPS